MPELPGINNGAAWQPFGSRFISVKLMTEKGEERIRRPISENRGNSLGPKNLGHRMIILFLNEVDTLPPDLCRRARETVRKYRNVPQFAILSVQELAQCDSSTVNYAFNNTMNVWAGQAIISIFGAVNVAHQRYFGPLLV